ncbi:NYN domain-containing protein [Chloroflexota bacterium]
MAERAMIFIDGSNLYHALKNNVGRTDMDIGRFCKKLLRKHHLVRIYYYNARVGFKEEPERFRRQQAFFAGLDAVPYTELRLGRLVYNNWPHVPPYEKGIDVQLATDMITHSFKNNYDIAVLVAGDSDFAGAIQSVKDNGKHVEVALFGKQGSSKLLRSAADRVTTINAQFLNDCWKETRSQKTYEPEQGKPGQ